MEGIAEIFKSNFTKDLGHCQQESPIQHHILHTEAGKTEQNGALCFNMNSRWVKQATFGAEIGQDNPKNQISVGGCSVFRKINASDC